MHYTAEDASKSFHIVHARRSENMPPPPQKAKLHPAALNNQVLENMLYSTTHKSLLKFLSSELDRVDKKMALELIESFGPEVGPMIMHGFCLAVMILPPGTFA